MNGQTEEAHTLSFHTSKLTTGKKQSMHYQDGIQSTEPDPKTAKMLELSCGDFRTTMINTLKELVEKMDRMHE